MTPILSECCLRYIEHGLDCHISFAKAAREYLRKEIEGKFEFVRSELAALENYGYDTEPIIGPVGMLSQIWRGDCPWHENGVPEDYFHYMHRVMPRV